MTLVRFRAAAEADYERIAQAVQVWWTLPGLETPAATRERAALLPRLFLQHFAGTSLVAERADDLVGFLVGFLSADRADEGYIHFVGVSPGARGEGLGRALYEQFFARCVREGRTRVRCVTSPGNQTSIAFHLALGFAVEAGSEQAGAVTAKANYDGPGVHRVSFVRSLVP
jgi:predicted GNAT superfamily acetyltransferase